jgi:regulator of protease activity HflC (stomatin/prohibitin superfamily)
VFKQVTFIKDGKVGLLYENGVLVRVLAPGRYAFCTLFAPQREIVQVDIRERSVTIKNQEILTADKVAIRISILVFFKTVDAKAALQNVESFEDRLYEDVQLAARRFLASRTLDQILRDRNDLSEAIREDVRQTAASYGVEIRRADVKDLVFPGNLRELMNKGIETERTWEANLIAQEKSAQAAKIQAESQAEIQKITAKAATFARQQELEADEKAAVVLKANPELLKLKEIEALREIGLKGGNHFYFGMDRIATGNLR